MVNARASLIAGGRVDLLEQYGGRVAIRADQRAHALDQVEQVLPLLTHRRAAQRHAELADVDPQFTVASGTAAVVSVSLDMGAEKVCTPRLQLLLPTSRTVPGKATVREREGASRDNVRHAVPGRPGRRIAQSRVTA